MTLADIGLAEPGNSVAPVLDWQSDTLRALLDLGRADVDVNRRRLLTTATYSLAALTIPDPIRWADQTHRAEIDTRSASARAVGRGDLGAVRDMIAAFSRSDQRRGGGHARTAAVQYLASDVATCLDGRFADSRVRREMFSAAGELAYLCGWMAFDNAEHPVAQHYFSVAVRLAAEADDPPLVGHVLRAIAHQAVDLRYPQQAQSVAAAAVAGDRYRQACRRERALLGVVQARTLAAGGNSTSAAGALLRAEDDLRAADSGNDEPPRVFFFGEASLAHETACALRDMGDLEGAVVHFRRSVRTRNAASFTRTHAVTLGYLGGVQARQGHIEEACATWSRSLDAMDGVRSGRTRQVAREMKSLLSPFRARGVRAVTDIDERATQYLSIDS